MNEKHFKNIITRHLPKTKQTVCYQAGDDGDTEIGWWFGRLNANNRDEFIGKTVGGESVVIQRSTGLMWVGDGDSIGCNMGSHSSWADAFAAIVNINLANFAGFNDWRLPNVFELLSILHFNLARPFIPEPPFSNTYLDRYWTSTTRNDTTTYAHIVAFGNTFQPAMSSLLKTSTIPYMRSVRDYIH